MNQKSPFQAVPLKKDVAVSGGDAELRMRLLERLNFLQEKVESFDFYIKKAKEMLDEESPKVSMLEIEKWISGIEHEMGYCGSESVKEIESGSFGKTEDMAIQKLTGNVEAEKTDSMKNDKIGMEMDSGGFLALHDTSKAFGVKHFEDIDLTTGENLDENVNRGNEGKMVTDEEIDESPGNRLHQIGVKVATGGWFVNEGELALLAHEDGCCSLYDVTNCEEKGEFKPQVKVPAGIWKDCWILRVAGVDGSLGKYVVAASAGNSKSSGFCSWEFYSKTIHSFHLEDALPASRKHPTSSTNTRQHKRDVLSVVRVPPANNVQWWYKPCGPLMVSAASVQQTVKVFDIRDGEQVMKFGTQMPISAMEYCSPLQWRDKGKVVLAEFDKISLWDVNSLSPRPIVSAQSCNQKITALHIGNRDAELSKGVRKRIYQPDSVRNDGVFCTAEFITLLDFHHPSGVGIRIPISNVVAKSVFSYGDIVLLGGCHQQSAGKQSSPQVQQFSLRKQKSVTVSTYLMPESNTPPISDDITQVWGDSNFVMAISSLGLGRFLGSDYNNTQGGVVIGPHDMYDPSFDFASSRILLVSRDRPALWMHII